MVLCCVVTVEMDSLWKMLPRSYASDGDEKKWLLFAREEQDALVFTVVIIEKEKNVVAEIQVDDDALKQHSGELGLEMQTHEFKTLVVKALEQRQCVDVEIEENDTVEEVFLSLTCKFSPTISRKGVFQLPIVAKDAPQSLVKLLTSIHTTPMQSMLSEQQKEKKRAMSTVVNNNVARGGDQTMSLNNSQENRGIATGSQGSESGKTTPAVNPMKLKRRHVPTGTMRRKGPKGAKLAKK